MGSQHPFRFGVSGFFPSSSAEWVDFAQKVESLGYSTLVMGDHPVMGGGPIAVLMAAAAATSSLRLGTHVLANDFRPPLLLAQEAAMLDLLSDGRLEFGIGSGWYSADYAACGLPLDPPAVRIRRLAETVALVKRLFADEEPVTFAGDYYQMTNIRLVPKPRQRPHPPLYIGGGGRQVLTLAAQMADIVGLDAKGTVEGAKDLATTNITPLMKQVEWVRQAAGARFDALELHLLVYVVTVTEDRVHAAEQVAAVLETLPSSLFTNTAFTIEQILASPRFLLGTVDQIVTELQERRACYGISYYTVMPEAVDVFGPVVAQLAGK